MKKLLIAVSVLATLLLSGCVVTPVQPVYTAPYYRPVPVYTAPVYVRPAPYCYWTQRYDNYYRVYRNVRICR
jgi:hypothetical protein